MNEPKWKLNRGKFLLRIANLISKYLVLPWALNLAIFSKYFPLETPNLYWALVITWFVWNLHTCLSHPPRYQEVKE